MHFWNIVLMIVMLFTALFLILLVLVQRGKGGGLAGAFGGMGGQSAFGTKAGDMFTKITIGMAFFWILLCIVAVKYSSERTSIVDQMGADDQPKPGVRAEKEPGEDSRTPPGTTE